MEQEQTPELTPEQKAAEEKEKKENNYKLMLDLLDNPALQALFAASTGKNTAQFGEAGNKASQFLYKQALSMGDPQVGNMVTDAYLEQLEKEEGNIYESGINLNASALLKNAQNVYMTAVGQVNVGDITKKLGIEKIDEKKISKDQLKMSMNEFAKKNNELYSGLMGTYASNISYQIMGQALMAQGASGTKNLEAMLAPEKKEENKN